jgi:phosphoserine phosphatase
MNVKSNIRNMPDRMDSLGSHLSNLEKELARLRADLLPHHTLERWRGDCLALLFHLRRQDDHPPLVAVLGGTGTGKSTIVNRLLESNASATSLRRTFTTGAIAAAHDSSSLPEGWLAVPHETASETPARGRAGSLAIIEIGGTLTHILTLVDTPDLDGDQPRHHAEADRVFRWAEALVFLVTPEKYQMTELLPYYRLARRYALPALFVMNKCEEAAVLEDFRKQLTQREWSDARTFAVPRDDAAYQPPADADLASLRTALEALPQILRAQRHSAVHRQALKNRQADLMGRLHDQILVPLREQRQAADQLVSNLRAMTAPPAGVDVSPLMRQLQRRLQEQSVLYLMGPQRMLDRVRQVPGMLLRLPRTAWDLLVRGQIARPQTPTEPSAPPASPPDFPKLLADQFTVLQSRIDDLLRSSTAAQGWMNRGEESYRQARFPSADASRIADQELADLKTWLEQRWHKAPRDTRILEKLLKLLPGGKNLTQWSEAAPYLLAIVSATTNAFFGPVDLLVIGSFTLATWLGEKLSNEVTARTRRTNRRIEQRFAQLAAEQIERLCAWLEQQAPQPVELKRLERLAEQVL